MKITLKYYNDKVPVSYTGIDRVIIYHSISEDQSEDIPVLQISHDGRHVTGININKVHEIKIEEEKQ